MKLILTVVGVIAILMGLLWMAQGSGIFPYPASSFMIDQSRWIAYGGVAILVGAFILWAGRR